MATSFTTTLSHHTVKPLQTTFTNDSGHVLTLRYQNGSSLVLAMAATSPRISTTISAINRGATNYYAASNYSVPADRQAVLTMEQNEIVITLR